MQVFSPSVASSVTLTSRGCACGPSSPASTVSAAAAEAVSSGDDDDDNDKHPSPTNLYVE